MIGDFENMSTQWIKLWYETRANGVKWDFNFFVSFFQVLLIIIMIIIIKEKYYDYNSYYRKVL